MRYGGSGIVGKFEEYPKCSGNICREVVTVNNAWLSGEPVLGYQTFLFFIPSIYTQ
jgi:hypothetical protein